MIDEQETKTNSASDKSCNDLLDSVIHELNDGRRSSDISAELVRQNWPKATAAQFCDLAAKICREMKQQPESRSACAHRGFEGMQAAAAWIGFGACGGAMMYLMGNNLRPYAIYTLLPILYGAVELISGFTLWYPHREFLKQESENPASRIRKS